MSSETSSSINFSAVDDIFQGSKEEVGWRNIWAVGSMGQKCPCSVLSFLPWCKDMCYFEAVSPSFVFLVKSQGKCFFSLHMLAVTVMAR